MVNVNKNQIIKMYKQGKSKRAIALLLNCSRAYVYKILAEAKLIKYKHLQ
jgi:DNA invertase Pin-like site-specific DNA recombinase